MLLPELLPELLLPPLELDPEPLPELPLEELPDPELLPPVVATEDPLLLFTTAVELFPGPLPVSPLPGILDKSENIGLSLFVIPYAATAAATHNTMIIEIIMFALSNFFPPFNYIYI